MTFASFIYKVINLYNKFKPIMKKKMTQIDPLYKNIANELNLEEIISIELIQTLWSGYGELVRVKFKNNSIIVKHVKLPNKSEHPRGWNTNLSHKRKVASYEVEVNWYKEFSNVIDERCRIPKGLMTFKTQEEFLIVMEDLGQIGLINTTLDANESHLKTCVSWLANFHAKYMGLKNDKLWDIGTYWHLDTRPDELKVLEDKDLKKYASKIDEILNKTEYQTIVHGDAKIANFCFNKDATECAAVDFQYIGHGCGMKDLAYFISSAIEPDKCKENEQWILDYYFKELKIALKVCQSKLSIQDIEKEWRPLFKVAWADFQRFIKGWSPNHYKINSYSEALTKEALDYIKSLEK